jgi:pimeloyl-ACP methyl ester carboxylesterase
MPIIRSGDADISYTVHGEGTPVLLIMGLAADQHMWMLQLPALQAAGYQAITFDNRGVGGSSAPPGPYTMEQMAADALAVLDALAIDAAHIVGISMGGAIAQHVVLKAPERVRSLMLVSTWAEKNEYTARLDELGALVLEKIGREALIKASMLWLFTPKMFIESPDLIRTIEQMAPTMQGDGDAFTAQTAAVVQHDTIERLHEIEVPTFVICGRRDVLVPPELSERIAARIPHATLKLIDGGHAFTFENVEEFNRELIGWLSTH